MANVCRVQISALQLTFELIIPETLGIHNKKLNQPALFVVSKWSEIEEVLLLWIPHAYFHGSKLI